MDYKQPNIPPPAYADGDHRPPHLWKLLNNDNGRISPYEPLSTLTWGHAANVVEWEMDLSRSSGMMGKLAVTRGPTAHNAPVAYTFKKLTRFLVTPDKKTEIECKYNVNRKTNAQTLSVKAFDGPARFGTVHWTTNQVMSTVNGVLFDDTRYTLADQWGTPLATFAWLCPDGSMDFCLQITAEGAKSDVPEDVMLVTLMVFVQDQWSTMLDEWKSTSMDGRIASVERVRDTLNQSAGRRTLYQMATAQDADAVVQNMRRQRSGRRRPDGSGGNGGTMAVMSSTAALC